MGSPACVRAGSQLVDVSRLRAFPLSIELEAMEPREGGGQCTYLVRAEVEKPGSGTFKTEADTKRDAIEKAQGLRSQGLRVVITGAKGERVDEAS